MKPVLEALEIYKFEPMDEHTRMDIECFLQTQYPEATWTVSFTDDHELYVTVAYKSSEEETFYKLKWL